MIFRMKLLGFDVTASTSLISVSNQGFLISYLVYHQI
jgi:hypothetical protein